MPTGSGEKASVGALAKSTVNGSFKDLGLYPWVSICSHDKFAAKGKSDVVSFGNGRGGMTLVLIKAGPDDALARDGIGRGVEGDVAEPVRLGERVGLFWGKLEPGRVVLGVGDNPAVLRGFDRHRILAADDKFES